MSINFQTICTGCSYLAQFVWEAGDCPLPPLHWGCRCNVEAIDTGGMSPQQRIGLALEARRNHRQRSAIVAEAIRRAAAAGLPVLWG